MAKRKDVQDQADDIVPATGESTPTPTEAASEIQAASGETPPAEAIKIEPITADSAPIELPLVESPNLDGSEPIVVASRRGGRRSSCARNYRQPPRPRQRRADRRVSPCWRHRLRLWLRPALSSDRLAR